MARIRGCINHGLGRAPVRKLGPPAEELTPSFGQESSSLGFPPSLAYASLAKHGNLSLALGVRPGALDGLVTSNIVERHVGMRTDLKEVSAVCPAKSLVRGHSPKALLTALVIFGNRSNAQRSGFGKTIASVAILWEEVGPVQDLGSVVESGFFLRHRPIVTAGHLDHGAQHLGPRFDGPGCVGDGKRAVRAVLAFATVVLEVEQAKLVPPGPAAMPTWAQ